MKYRRMLVFVFIFMVCGCTQTEERLGDMKESIKFSILTINQSNSKILGVLNATKSRVSVVSESKLASLSEIIVNINQNRRIIDEVVEKIQGDETVTRDEVLLLKNSIIELSKEIGSDMAEPMIEAVRHNTIDTDLDLILCLNNILNIEYLNLTFLERWMGQGSPLFFDGLKAIAVPNKRIMGEDDTLKVTVFLAGVSQMGKPFIQLNSGNYKFMQGKGEYLITIKPDDLEKSLVDDGIYIWNGGKLGLRLSPKDSIFFEIPEVSILINK